MPPLQREFQAMKFLKETQHHSSLPGVTLHTSACKSLSSAGDAGPNTADAVMPQNEPVRSGRFPNAGDGMPRVVQDTPTETGDEPGTRAEKLRVLG